MDASEFFKLLAGVARPKVNRSDPDFREAKKIARERLREGWDVARIEQFLTVLDYQHVDTIMADITAPRRRRRRRKAAAAVVDPPEAADSKGISTSVTETPSRQMLGSYSPGPFSHSRPGLYVLL